MPKQITVEQIEARLAMYDEAMEHLQLSVHETPEEIKQAKIVITQINQLAIRFAVKYAHRLKSTHNA